MGETGGKSTFQIGSKKLSDLNEKNFASLALIAHHTKKGNVTIGVRRTRLNRAVASATLTRQRLMFQRACNSARRLKQHRKGGSRWIIKTYSMEWDGTRTRFKMAKEASEKRRKTGRGGKMAVASELISARGSCRWLLHDSERGTSAQFGDEWLARPMRCEGTSAEEIFNAVLAAMPEELHFTKPALLRVATSGYDFLHIHAAVRSRFWLRLYFEWLWRGSPDGSMADGACIR